MIARLDLDEKLPSLNHEDQDRQGWVSEQEIKCGGGGGMCLAPIHIESIALVLPSGPGASSPKVAIPARCGFVGLGT